MAEYKLSKRSLQNLEGVHPDLIKLIKNGILDSPCDFTVTEGVRTLERQQELYAQGRTKTGTIVTNVNGVDVKSAHQVRDDGYGHAIDIYPYVNGQVRVNDVENLKLLGKHLKNIAALLGIRLSWGGDWRMRDYPHFEVE